MCAAGAGAHVVRVGIVGAGANTRERHIPGLRAIPGVEIVSVCNRHEESTKAVAAEFGIPTTYARWEDLVAARDTDAIVIGTWPYLHHAVTVAALQAGKHVLCEARMAMNLGEARAMQRVAQARSDLVAQLVPAPFTLHVDRTMVRLIADGYLGELLSVDLRANTGAFLDKDGPMTWRRDAALSGNNIMSMGIWYETLMRWVGEATRVYAAGRVYVRVRMDPATRKPREVTVPEHLDVIAQLRGGAQAHLQISSVHGLQPENDVTLFGSEGTLRFTGNGLFGGRRGDKKMRKIVVRKEDMSRWRVEEEFINAIHGTEEVSMTDFATGVRYMAFTDAVQQSLREARHVNVAT